MKYFENALVLVEGEGLKKCDLQFSERIVGFEKADEKIALPEGAIVVPGFIDEHVHGAGGADMMDATKDALSVIAKTLAAEGTTSFLATTMTQEKGATCAALRAANEYYKDHVLSGARLVGVHAEGPFISQKYCGAQPQEYIAAPSVSLFDELNKASGGLIRLVTLAPEQQGAEALIAHLTAKGVTCSIGHSDATHEVVQRAADCGASCVTHTYNAQRGVHHREIGVTGSALLMDGLYTELICDGIHVSIPAVRLLLKNKPKSKVILITDAIRAKGLGDGESELGGQKVYVKNGEARLESGTLAGSVLKMNDAVKNLVERAGATLEEAVACASLNPAANLGIDKDYGSIRPGKAADFAVLDKAFRVIMTVRGGECIYKG